MVAAMLVAGSPMGTAMPMDEGSEITLVYELYSWPSQGENGWRFSLLPGLASRRKTAREIFDPANTVSLEGLESKFRDLPKGTDLVLIGAVRRLDRDPATGTIREGDLEPGTERLRVPPKSVIRQLTALAEKHGLRLDKEIIN
jgi:hypothetical protein